MASPGWKFTALGVPSATMPATTASPHAPPEVVHPLDGLSLETFAVKGVHILAGEPRPKGLATNGNGVRVRRVMQLTRDLSPRPFNELRILDHACGDGVYSIEAALRGAQVLAMDARNERMDEGAAAARRLGLANVQFEQQDVRKVTRATHGDFDVIYFLGILYHLDVPDVFHVVETLYDMCRSFVIIDTEIAPAPQAEVQHKGSAYFGVFGHEHAPSESPEARRAKLRASLDNPRCFLFTRDSLVRLLHDVGFTSVNLCLAPFEPDKRPNRVTLVAHRGEPVKVSTYPWVNDKTEAEIARAMGTTAVREAAPPARQRASFRGRLRAAANAGLRRFGLELRRVK